jgi:hypothetical protein
LYTPRVGENAVLHLFDIGAGKTLPSVEAWTNTTALARFIEEMQNERYQRERTKVLGNPKALADVNKRIKEALLKEPIKRGEIVNLPDMTPVRVRVLATFYNFNMPDTTTSPLDGILWPDHALVEVLDGSMKGRFFWASRFAVRVPGAPYPKLPDLSNLESKTDDTDKVELAPAPTGLPKQLTPKLLVESSSWNRLSDFVQVHCRIRNISDHSLGGLTATVVYEDAAGNVVYSGRAPIGDLEPGETKTIMTMDQYITRMDHYKFEFEGKDGDRRGGIGFTTAGASGATGRRR